MNWPVKLPLPRLGKKEKSKATDPAQVQKKIYTVFAGVNGSGKTSLFEILKTSASLGERVNIDEIALTFGSWKDSLVQLKASREAMKKINECISAGVSFHQETTLPGATLIRCIKDARNAGFTVRLYFIGVDTCETAINRVHRRVERGGHGIDDEVIRKRYETMPERLKEILPLCDAVIFYDNTLRFRQIGIMRRGEIIDLDPDLPNWFSEIIQAEAEQISFRTAKHQDLNEILTIYEEARASIGALGIDQWQNGYPDKAVIEQDIRKSECNVLCTQKKITAVFALLFREEPTYREIHDGKWLTGDNADYAALHRFAVSGRSRRRGLATSVIHYVCKKCEDRGIASIRIDTHEGNVPMRRMLEKNGFVHCGTIYLESGDKRVAYEKIISQ